MSEMQTVAALAQDIYSEVYGEIDDREFRSRKLGEIEDWLREGDAPITGNESAAILGAEWMEYDAEDVKARLG